MATEQKVIVITGGASGIGFACAKAFLSNQPKAVILLDNNEKAGRKSTELLSKEFQTQMILFIKTDVSNRKSFENAFEQAFTRFNRIDVLVNSAGIMDEFNWEKMVDVNVKGIAIGCQLATEKYLKNNSGSVVVNLSSLAGIVSCDEAPFYTMTKFAVTGLTRAMGSEFCFQKTGVKIISVCPGKTLTPILNDLQFKGVYGKELDEAMKMRQGQSAEELATCILDIMKKAKTGSSWVVRAGNIFEVEYSDAKRFF